MLYREHYCDAYDYVITCIKEWFDQPDLKYNSQIQSLLLKHRNGLLYQEQNNIVGEIYKDGFNAFIVDAQLRFLPKIIEGSDPSPLQFNKCL